MRRIHLAMAGGAMLATLLAGAPAAASPAQPGAVGSASQAAPTDRGGRAERVDLPRSTPQDGARAAAAADGYFYAYEHAYWGGRWCAWAGNASNWVNPGGAATTGQWDCGGDYSFDNIATSVWNNGVYHDYDAVRMRTGAFLTGGSMCLSRGDYWADFTLGYQAFDDGTPADNQISSHYWSVSCS
ncbi:hypothetical protein [Micromonospora ureilytica]|uniref:Peptidase inhibitor family I36 n=1 Tax=Micromonospora ureilytica TaxID=709868 RepID=A0ABS0JE24_9ACTN|nr:hypothetical protein [Micromonospora ureilytica]MBG6065313.1 hypothetical protein [Micromonospora ureilytica]WSR55046.1 hypothetical protein OG400_25150 [Micromonospora ureilytica]